MALSDNLISYWPCDEASGNLLDAHGGNHLAETSGTVGATTGIVSGARDLVRADTEYFAIADNPALSTGDIDFTLQVWVRPTTLVLVNGYPGIVSKDAGGGSNREYGIYFDRDANRFRFYVSVSGATIVSVDANNLGAPSALTWYLIHGWHDSINNQIGIAVNAGTPNTASHSTGVFNGTAAFEVGRLIGTHYLDGLVDEIALWKRVLTSGERTDLYNAGAGRNYAYITGGGTFKSGWARRSNTLIQPLVSA